MEHELHNKVTKIEEAQNKEITNLKIQFQEKQKSQYDRINSNVEFESRVMAMGLKRKLETMISINLSCNFIENCNTYKDSDNSTYCNY